MKGWGVANNRSRALFISDICIQVNMYLHIEAIQNSAAKSLLPPPRPPPTLSIQEKGCVVGNIEDKQDNYVFVLFFCSYTLQGKSHFSIPFLGIAWPQSQFPHSRVCERFIYSQDRSVYFPAAEQADRTRKCINLSQIYECRNWETEHYNYVLEITVSFLGIHKWEPDIYTGFSPALHLQCSIYVKALLLYYNIALILFTSSM